MVKPEANVFLWGSHGTGKTLLAMEAVKGRVQKFLLNRLLESSINFDPTHPLVP